MLPRLRRLSPRRGEWQQPSVTVYKIPLPARIRRRYRSPAGSFRKLSLSCPSPGEITSRRNGEDLAREVYYYRESELVIFLRIWLDETLSGESVLSFRQSRG